ncbi:hypothetical protein BD310DRAFT_957925 [Dichomitus squalens]|uniref:RNA polymerase II degradation factor 1 n=1 Tax=Dichomitus squalens TaxID=114155 RepID=A0A4Q9PYK5_9APHY|nr:hypothetical protein BD310DRAFT_957925 [Dichomitus squalens]
MYKSSNFRSAQPQSDSPSDRYRAQAKQLQEAFPSWSYDDLQSLLVEVSGDVELASTRIIEGHAVQWGSVTRKKDKKPSSTSSYSKDPAGRERGEFRGGRGGRAARGGPRGGAARGAGARGAHHEVNGHRAKAPVSGQNPKDAAAAEPATPVPVNGDATEADPEASAWSSSTPATWGGDTAAINGTAPSAAAPPAAHSIAVPAPAQAPTHNTAKVVSTPATSKLSWAQIARKQEKPTPPAPAPQPAPVSVPSPPPAPVQQPEPTPPPEVEDPVATSTGWEEPTTVQAPTWDDEPRPARQAESVSAPAAPEEAKPAQPEAISEEEPVPDRVSAAIPPGVVQPPAPESPAALPPKPLTPSVSTRPTPAPHRANPKFKTTDQPVVLPASFGSGVEKIGMQFGSLSLGGEDFDAPAQEPSPAEQKAPQPVAPEPAPAPVVQPQEPAAPITSPPSQTSLPSAPLFQSSISQPSQQSSQPQQVSQLPAVSQQTQQSTLPPSLTQPSLTTPSSLPSSSANSAISPYSQQSQPSLASHQTHQTQSQAHHSFGQHVLPTHLDQVQSQQQHTAPAPSQQQQQQPTAVGQGQNIGGPSSYFRQPEAPYFHSPTPPAGQSQDSPYGAFGQLGQHQGQGSHLGNFGGADYGYGESQRNFYDSYSGPTGFGNRSALGHDDLGKTLPGSQQPHAAPGLPPANAQNSQQHPGAPSSQTSSQGQPNASQGPQQGYPPPLPYYYPPYPQSQYYGSPYNSGYTVPQPFVKYPTVFQGPPGPQSAPSPAAKQVQGPNSVQPQSPYGQSLYGQHQQHPSSAYDDIGGYQPHHAQHQHSVGQNVNVTSGLPSSEYGKHQSLYGSTTQGMQGFMGLGQSSAPSSGPPGALGQRAAAGSPENAYKPYGGNVGVKDVAGGVGVGQGGVGQGPQGGRGVQQPGQGSFYAQRYAASQAAVPQGQQGQQPQSQGPQGHLGYPQGGSDGSTFYSYQPRQQQGYWQ